MGFNINDEIRELAKGIIKNANDFEMFVSLSKFKMPNAKTGTLGGDIWYENIFEIDGWKIQCHSGLLQNHYRILDANDRRRAWTLDPKELKANLIIFKDNK